MPPPLLPAHCKKSPQNRTASRAAYGRARMRPMDIAEILRRLENLIKRGEIAEVNPAQGLVRVAIGRLRTEWLPYFVPAAGGVSVHRPPSVGEICIVLSPSGETAAGMVLCGLAGNAYPSPSGSAGETVTLYPDGAIVKYKHDSSAMEITGIKTGYVQAAEKITIDCPQTTTKGALTVEGLFTYMAGMVGAGGGAGGSGTRITGPIEHVGEYTNTGSVVSNGVNLSEHDHDDLTSGGKTGKANP